MYFPCWSVAYRDASYVASTAGGDDDGVPSTTDILPGCLTVGTHWANVSMCVGLYVHVCMRCVAPYRAIALVKPQMFLLLERC